MMTDAGFPAPSYTRVPDHAADRPAWPAIRRGVMRRCPACGEGALFRGYLQIRPHCPACGEALHHHRADDAPAYLTILILAHVLSPALLIVFLVWRPSVTAMMIGFLSVTVILALVLLPLLKGGLVGLQWARRMHGFGAGDAASD